MDPEVLGSIQILATGSAFSLSHASASAMSVGSLERSRSLEMSSRAACRQYRRLWSSSIASRDTTSSSSPSPCAWASFLAR